MDPHAPPSLSALAFFRSCWSHRQLLQQLTRREIAQRYRGSYLGLFWSLLNPILMLLVYTFVFSKVLKAQWSPDTKSTAEFAVILYSGICIFNLFADVVNGSPRLVLNHGNFVKRVVFPIEFLPVISIASALFHFCLQIAALLAAQLVLLGHIQWTVVALPIIVLPLVLFSLGLAWIISSLGVFIRDIGPLVTLSTTALMFLSPVFYSSDAVPSQFQSLLSLNPLKLVINQSREALIWGRGIDAISLLQLTLLQLVFAWAGYCWFQSTKKGFADVL